MDVGFLLAGTLGREQILAAAQRIGTRLAKLGQEDPPAAVQRRGVGDQPLAGDVGGEMVEVGVGELARKVVALGSAGF